MLHWKPLLHLSYEKRRIPIQSDLIYELYSHISKLLLNLFLFVGQQILWFGMVSIDNSYDNDDRCIR